MNRREFLKLGATWTLTASTIPADSLGSSRQALPALPRVNGGINVQPLRRLAQTLAPSDPDVPLIQPELVDLQMKMVYELGFQWIRITISFDRFGPDFLAAIPYVRSARALGVNVLGILGQFEGLDLLRQLSRSSRREEVLRTYLAIFNDFVPPATSAVESPGLFAMQVLNEPTNFTGISPRTYVLEFLAPVFEDLKKGDPQLMVAAAAAVGNADGILRTQSMLEVGVENYCDRIAYHIYDPRWIPQLAERTIRPIWVTESGVAGPDRHLDWITQTFDEIRSGIGGVEEIFYFDLFDTEPNRFRLINIENGPDGGFREVVESPAAVSHLVSRVIEGGGNLPRAAYRDLVPDITRYFPTEEDLALIAETSFGQEP